MKPPFPGRRQHRAGHLSTARLVLMLLIAATGSRATAESRLLFEYPTDFGEIPAATYNAKGKRIGDASIRITLEEELGFVEIDARSGIDGGARNQLNAVLEVVAMDDEKWLRPLYQRSQSFDPNGEPLVILEVDHRDGQATCTPPRRKSKKAVVVPLPKRDRVVNVPMSLFFLPLVRGEVEKLDFQVFFCLGGPRVLDFEATAEDYTVHYPDRGSRLRLVRFGPKGASLMSWIARAVMPKLGFWFDDGPFGGYVAHRMPLYSKGPDVIIVRDGFSVQQLIRDVP